MSKLFKTVAIVVLLCLVMSVMAPGCGQTPAPTEPPKTEEPTEAPKTEEPTRAPAAVTEEGQVRLALVMIGEITDLSWNAQMHRAVQEVGEEMGIETAYSEQVSDADVERVLREYADEGYNLIIAHSFSFGDAVFRVAEDYPEVNFAWAGGINKTANNVADYDQPFYEAAYLIGIIAGATSETGVLNSLGGFDIPVCHSMAEAFKLGAQTVNPDAKLLSSYVGDWGDVAKAKEAAMAQIEAGADFAIGCGEGPTLGSIEAAKEKDVMATGYVGNMTEIAPDTVAVSLVWDLNSLVSQMVKDTQEGKFQPGQFYSFGIAKGGLKVVFNPEFEKVVPQETLDKVKEVEQSIKDGEFEVPYVPE